VRFYSDEENVIVEDKTYGVSLILGVQLYPSYLVYYLPKNTPYTELLSENQQRLVEAGIIRKLYNKHMLKEIPPDKASTEINLKNTARIVLSHQSSTQLIRAVIVIICV
jgi:hypothetical protein